MVNYDPVQLAKDIGETLPKFTQGAQQAIRALPRNHCRGTLAIDGSFDVIPALAGGRCHWPWRNLVGGRYRP